MTKELMIDWIKTCVFPTSNTGEAYLIVDSWSSFRDINSIKKAVPEGVYNFPSPHFRSALLSISCYVSLQAVRLRYETFQQALRHWFNLWTFSSSVRWKMSWNGLGRARWWTMCNLIWHRGTTYWRLYHKSIGCFAPLDFPNFWSIHGTRQDMSMIILVRLSPLVIIYSTLVRLSALWMVVWRQPA